VARLSDHRNSLLLVPLLESFFFKEPLLVRRTTSTALSSFVNTAKTRAEPIKTSRSGKPPKVHHFPFAFSLS
jgi:hypothetical protein